jgi:phosphate-selective porin OprO/OprP
MLVAKTAHAATADELEQRIHEQEEQLKRQDARIKALEELLSGRTAKESLVPDASLQGTPGKAPPEGSTAPGAPVVVAGDKRFAFGSPDGANQVRFHAIVDADGRYFANSYTPSGADGFLIRQARPIIEGTFSQIYDFRITPDFGMGKDVLQDAYITGHYRPWLQITVGKFKTPFGLERLQYDTDVRFIERGLPNNLVPNRDIGVQLAGQLDGLTYALALQNGAADGASSDAVGDVPVENAVSGTARLFMEPFTSNPDSVLRGLGLGVAANYTSATGTGVRTLLPSYYSPGQQAVFAYRGGATPAVMDGSRTRVSPQAYWYAGPFGLLAEFVEVRQHLGRLGITPSAVQDVRQRAAQLEVTYVLTGETNGYKAPAPAAPFAAGHGVGAWELVARVGELAIDPRAFAGGANSLANPTMSIQKGLAWAIGVNWYLTASLKTELNYEQTRFKLGNMNGDRPMEKALLGRVQLGF